MQPITGCPSLFPHSHARSLISFPCGSPATVYYGETVAKNRVYHVPILADAHEFQRVYPFSTCLSPGSACGDVSLSSRGTTGYPTFWSAPVSSFGSFFVTRVMRQFTYVVHAEIASCPPHRTAAGSVDPFLVTKVGGSSFR